jgi:probable phosphoglycerate mutase
LILVRHGMSLDTERDVFAGAALPGPPLSQAGHWQAEAAARELERMIQVPWFGLAAPEVVLSSPVARAWQTAEHLARRFNLPIEADAAFAEQDFGLWDTLTKAEINARWPGAVERWAREASYAPVGGESREAVGRRLKAGVERVVGAWRGRSVAIATHAVATRAVIGAALGAPPDAWFAFRVAPASISVLRFWDLGHTEVVCTNRTP